MQARRSALHDLLDVLKVKYRRACPKAVLGAV